MLEKVLQRDPDYVPAFNRLARIYETHEEWEKCAEVLQRALALGPTGRDAADLYFRLGEVQRHQNGDIDAAVNYFAQALQYEPVREARGAFALADDVRCALTHPDTDEEFEVDGSAARRT